MTVNTQELRELLKKSCIDRLYIRTNRHADTGGKRWGWTSTQPPGSRTSSFDLYWAEGDSTEARAQLVVTVINALPALLDEIDRLRAELQARQWQPIETCPRKHGKHYLICKDCGPGSLPSISIGFCFDDQKDWHLMDSNCTAEMYGYRVTHWQPLPLPPAPPQGD